MTLTPKNNFNKILIPLMVIVLVAVVLVIKDGQPSNQVAAFECKAGLNQAQCWESEIDYALTTSGVDKAFDIISRLYSAEPAFAAECHSYVHKLGDNAYVQFALGEEIDLSPKTSYCGYGFYHGFMENLLLNDGLEQARTFCHNAGIKLVEKTVDAEGACYHGVGHGAVDGSDPRAWGNPFEILKPGIDLCEKITQTSNFLYRCVTGAYNSIEILSQDPKYKLQQMLDNPFFICPSQPEAYREGCYSNMIPALLRFVGNDFEKAIAMVSNTTETIATKRQVVEGLVYEFIRPNISQPALIEQQGLKLCRSIADALQTGCVKGLSGGLMKYGEPQVEYVKALDLCQADMTATEADACYASVLSRLRIWYTKEKSREICSQSPKAYQFYCNTI